MARRGGVFPVDAPGKLPGLRTLAARGPAHQKVTAQYLMLTNKYGHDDGGRRPIS